MMMLMLIIIKKSPNKHISQEYCTVDVLGGCCDSAVVTCVTCGRVRHIPPTGKSIQYTLYCVLCIVDCLFGKLFTELCTLYSVHCKLYTELCTVYTVHCKLYTELCTFYIVHCKKQGVVTLLL